MTVARVLTVPGWHGSGPEHWQSRWEALYGYRRVEQHDWDRPLRGDWNARLEDEILAGAGAPTVLVAHSLGCALVAAWAAHSRNTRLVRAALLVAPPDLERDDLRAQLHGWSPLVLQRLPFISTVIASSDDPYASLARSREFAAAWGAALVDVGAQGHLNAASGLGDWPRAHAYLREAAGAAAVALPTAPVSTASTPLN
ncbi:alpha/beta fold hydrolase [Xylophilus rhododendri]|uniref:Alpha/beta fold hydrolase n=1 Tax=Xylophilus rhododendri TaxID=2697032 RepID=A0A857J724_9BURK|nr:alpha/beta fold hydrolase [Xylophilus rhododendri]QHI98879.1 alpha/beta fold hydrolase [Xylophilus rhododendri]